MSSTRHEIATADLTDAICSALASDGADARLVARWVIEAEILGLPAFGVAMLVRELDRLSGHQAHPAPPTIAPPRASIDATTIPGQLALARAVQRALEASGPEGTGTTLIGLRNVGALGVIGSAARTLALGGLVGVVMANSPAAVAPWGGHARAIGTNPLAVAVPRHDHPPLVLDFATSPTTLAALRAARERGTAIDGPGGYDLDGHHTSDPARIDALAPAGKISSLTGLAIEMIVGVGLGAQVDTLASGGGRGALVLALDPAAFGAEDTAAGGDELSRAWAGAGGHVPARFDALPAAAAALPATVNVAPVAYERLVDFAHNRRRHP